MIPALLAAARVALPMLARGAAVGAGESAAAGAGSQAIKSAAIQGMKSAAPRAAVQGAIAGRQAHMDQGRQDGQRPTSMF